MIIKEAKHKYFKDYFKIKSEKSNMYWTGWNEKPNYENIKNFYISVLNNSTNRKDRKIYLAFENNEVIGYFYIDYVDEDTFHISPAISEKYQGKGYGKELIRLAIEKGKELGFSKAEAYIREDNIASQKCFEYNGLHKTDTFEMKYIENMQKDVKMIRYFGEIK